MTLALEGGEGSASHPSHSLPPGKTRCPLYRRLGGPKGRSGQVWKISPTPGFDPRTVQPVTSRYTDYDYTTRPVGFSLHCQYIFQSEMSSQQYFYISVNGISFFKALQYTEWPKIMYTHFDMKNITL